MRRMLAVTVAAVLVASGSASATVRRPKPKPKPKPLCNLVTDPAGDGGATSTAAGDYDPAIDIVSADVVSDGTTVTAAIRVKQLTESSTTTPTGRYYQFRFYFGTYAYNLDAYFGPVAPAGPLATFSPAVADLAHNEIRITKKVSEFTGTLALKRGDLLTKLSATADLGDPLLPVSGTVFGYQADTAGDLAGATPKPYPVGAASCVKLGG